MKKQQAYRESELNFQDLITLNCPIKHKNFHLYNKSIKDPVIKLTGIGSASDLVDEHGHFVTRNFLDVTVKDFNSKSPLSNGNRSSKYVSNQILYLDHDYTKPLGHIMKLSLVEIARVPLINDELSYLSNILDLKRQDIESYKKLTASHPFKPVYGIEIDATIYVKGNEDTINKIERDLYRCFSIGFREINKKSVKYDPKEHVVFCEFSRKVLGRDASILKIDAGKVVEISLVSMPANPACVITDLGSEVENIEISKKKFTSEEHKNQSKAFIKESLIQIKDNLKNLNK